jgi:8-oxo-dGTP pyrophosphatase MutT (NUDIX family)
VPPGWEPQLNEEHDDYRWLPQDEAVELLYWPEPKELLRAL